MPASSSEDLRQTPLFDLHVELGAKMVPFAGYSMPVQYPDGILTEHNHTRAGAGLFDVSHMAQVSLTLPSFEAAAAVIPPVFEPPLWEERAVVDGGMADQAPMPEPDKGETLILLTREYKNIPDIPGRFYVHPSKETPADKIDFTDPGKLRKTWDLEIL